MIERNCLSSPLVFEELQSLIERMLAPGRAIQREIKALWRTAFILADAPGPIDTNDARLLQPAVAAGVEHFVTGDKALLGLGRKDRMVIVSPRQMYERLTRAL